MSEKRKSATEWKREGWQRIIQAFRHREARILPVDEEKERRKNQEKNPTS